MRCKYCSNQVMAHGMCRKHLVDRVRRAEKMVRTTRIKGTPYRPTPDTCIEGVYMTRYKDEK